MFYIIYIYFIFEFIKPSGVRFTINQTFYFKIRFANSSRQRRPSFGVIIVLSGFTEELGLDSYFCTWPY